MKFLGWLLVIALVVSGIVFLRAGQSRNTSPAKRAEQNANTDAQQVYLDLRNQVLRGSRSAFSLPLAKHRLLEQGD